MKIAIYCAALTNNKEYISLTEELCLYLASHNHSLVYGGGKTGLMGVCADTFIKSNAYTYGVFPHVEEIMPRIHRGLSELIMVDTMAERRSKMIELSDIFIALPGGVGTLDELSEVCDYIKLSLIKNKKIIIYNMLGFYDGLLEQYKRFVQEGMLDNGLLQSDIIFCANIDEIKRVLE